MPTSADDPHVTVSIDRDHNPFTALNDKERMRLFIRVLCELVAYGEPTGDAPESARARPAPLHRQHRTATTS